MKIRYSHTKEIEIEASQGEMKSLKRAISELLATNEEKLNIDAETNYNPEPYELLLETLSIKISTVNSVSKIGQKLYIIATPEFAKSLASNLPTGVEQFPYHVHYDHVSFPQFLNSEAPEIVFSATI